MPTIYRNNNNEVKVTASKEFINQVAAAESEVIVANKISKMQFNLKHQEYQELFAQYKRQQEEHKQRLQRIEQQQSRRQQQQPRYVDNSSSSNRENNNNSSSNENKEAVIRNLKFMQRIAGPNP